MIDGFWDKQIAMANLSRNMAGPPFHLLNASYDFCLSQDGQRMPHTEEIPLYHGLVALGYRIFGEQDWFGRAVSAAGSLLAIAAFMGLMRREYDYGFAVVAGVIFAVCPLLLYYGRAVVPDTCMLGCMLAAAYGFRRALDDNSLGWLIASGFAGLMAMAFKYFGLIVLLPMAEMAWRGQRAKGLAKLCLPAAMMVVPLAAWMSLIFFRIVQSGSVYCVFYFSTAEYFAGEQILDPACRPVLVEELRPIECDFDGRGIIRRAFQAEQGRGGRFMDHYGFGILLFTGAEGLGT